MNICVFLGPTLPIEEAARILDAVYLPPAAQGDVLMAVEDGADVIGIVDGCFQGVPSVWHKEILWAMSRGVHVYGSSSMGALRAAELSVFGMQGVGRVFEAYRDGVIDDDDEVAVVHGPEEMGYRSATVPLVNMRATLAHALVENVISKNTHDGMIDVARSLNYWDRSYDALLEKCSSIVGPEVSRDLAEWIAHHGIDQKRDDAVELLRKLGDIQSRPFDPGFHFQRTDAWESLVDDVRARNGVGTSRDTLTASLVECGSYVFFSERAAEKERILSAQFGAPPEYADAMLTPAEVLTWFFEDCQGMTVPMDLEGYARDLGLQDAGALCRVLLHELLYEMSRETDGAADPVEGVPI